MGKTAARILPNRECTTSRFLRGIGGGERSEKEISFETQAFLDERCSGHEGKKQPSTHYSSPTGDGVALWPQQYPLPILEQWLGESPLLKKQYQRHGLGGLLVCP